MRHIWRKRTKRALLLVALPIMLAFTLAATLIVADGLTDDIQAADVAIVPGNTVEKDGRPSARLSARLDQTVALYRQGLFRDVIVSGGVGSEGFDDGRCASTSWLKWPPFCQTSAPQPSTGAVSTNCG